MSDIPRVKVVNEREGWLGTQCYINDQKIERVRGIDFHVAVDEIPKFYFEMSGMPKIDMPGDVRFSFAPHTVEEAVKVLRHELLKHGDLYDGFRASISSTLKEIPAGMGVYDVAEKILDGMIGEE